MDAMTGADIIAHGLAGDDGEVCLSFVRIFDTNWHDPALTLGQKGDFAHVLTTLFPEGHILAAARPPDARVQALPGGETPAKTLTQIAMELLEPSRDASAECSAALVAPHAVVGPAAEHG